MGAPVDHKRMKPKAGAKPTAAERLHMERVAGLPCLVSGKRPVTVHHVTGYADRMGRFSRSHRWVVPLLARFHLIQDGPHESVERLSHQGFYRRHGIDLLKEARDAQFANRQRYLTAEDRLETVTTERDEAVRNYSEMSGIVSQRDAAIVALRAEIDDLKPDAERFRARRASAKTYDKNRRTKTGAATGKPRTAIPAKVGKTVSATISGGRPAKKAVR